MFHLSQLLAASPMFQENAMTKMILAALLLLAAPPVIAGSIVGSAHDFASYNWSSGQVCIACHDQHHADTNVTVAPQWSHALSTQSYALYSTPSLKAQIGQPGMLSKLCLSCHDGTVAVDRFGGAAGSKYISTANNIGTSLKDDHPIGFTYDTALANLNGSLFDPATKTVTIGSGVTIQFGTIASVMLFSGRLECSSCHDVHNKYTTDAAGLLKISAAGSAICIACHKK
jgi:predicted CXXCH cytochrome family protein